MSGELRGNTGRIVLRDGGAGAWRHYENPVQILTTRRLDRALPLIREVEAAVQNDGLHAAGFIAYEAAPAFDPSLPAREDGAFPLLWFGLFERFAQAPLPEPDPGDHPPLSWQSTASPETYRQCLRDIRQYIRDGDTYQVNYTYRLLARMEVDPWPLFVRMAGGDGAGAPYAAYLDTGDWVVCSASPELFFRLDGAAIESRPMKGTMARGRWYEEDQAMAAALRHSEKDRAENVMIVDMVRNDLGRLALTGSVQVPALFDIERYPTVWQMTSTVRARTQAPLDHILQCAFPPASITGAPKRRTMQIIAEMESTPRRIYTGTIGFLDPGRQGQFNVAIRTLLFHRPTGRAEYGVGGGIVWDSRPEQELAECRAKTKALRPPARDFDLLETMLWTPAQGIALLEYHLKRLAQSADYFGFQASIPDIRDGLEGAVAALPAAPHRLRLLLSRGGGARWETTRLDGNAMGFADLVLAAHPIDRQDAFLFHKTTRRGVYEEAKKTRPGAGDVLLFNDGGEITESTIANVAVEIDGVLWTPPLRCGLLPGTRRAWMLDHERLRERVITVEEALASPNVFLLNAVRGFQKAHIRDAEGGGQGQA